MRKSLLIFIGIFASLAASRFIPHPPNFTALIALGFYIPVFFGLRFVPIVAMCFAITDIFIGFHSTTLFTWGSILIIGYISRFFVSSIISRIFGAISCALIFFIITNFGVWFGGMYQPNFNGLLLSYTMALPFLGYSILSTLLFSTIIETFLKFKIFQHNKI
jgi:hypothetical protein